MKKIVLFVVILFVLFTIHASVVDIFHIPTSYSEIAKVGYKDIEGHFNFNKIPLDIADDESDPFYFFYGIKRLNGFFFRGSSDYTSLIECNKITRHIKNSETFWDYELYNYPYNSDGTLYGDYYPIEEGENRVVFVRKSDETIRVEYEDFGTFQRKIFYVGDSVIFCHFIISTKEIDGIKYPTDERLYYPAYSSGKLIYKKTIEIGKIGDDYGPFNKDRLVEFDSVFSN